MKFRIVAIIVVVAAGVAAWLSSSNENIASEDIPVISLGYRPSVVVDMGMLLALQQNLDEEYGLDVKLKPYGNAPALFAGLKSGEIIGSLGAPLEPVLSMQKEDGSYPYRGYIVWYFDQSRAFDGFLVKADSTLTSVEELGDGSTVGSHPSKQVTKFVEVMAPKASVKTYNPASPLLPLQNGDVDAIYALEPFISKAVASGKFRILESASIGKRLFKQRVPAAISLLSSSWVQENPEVAQKFIKFARSVHINDFSNESRTAVVDLLQDKDYGAFKSNVAEIVVEPSSSFPEELRAEELELFRSFLATHGLAGKTANASTLFITP